MKVFIWVSCYFILALFQTAARESGIIIGAIPLILLYSLLFWIAKKLCNYWDERQAEKSASIASEAPIPEEPPAPDPEPTPTISDPTAPAPATPKLRYCKHCGSPIDPATRQCTGCGKQYFRPPVLHKKHLAIVGAVLACVAVALLIFNLTSRLSAADAQLAELNSQIAELESSVAEQERQIDIYKRNEDAYSAKLAKNTEQCNELRSENAELKDQLGRYECIVAIVGDTGAKIYHKLGCPYMEKEWGFYVYSIPFVQDNGYAPCSHCCG